MGKVCPVCRCDLRVKRAEKREEYTTYTYTCPNKRCANYMKDTEKREVKAEQP